MSWDPLPSYSCEHLWKSVGKPYVIHATANTKEEKIPPGSPIAQKQQCLLCNGVQYIQYGVTE